MIDIYEIRDENIKLKERITTIHIAWAIACLLLVVFLYTASLH